ncbi:MoaD/ThiS family protein [Haloechinothrix salitolerans]|uniref:MoaD/ThiS family protein n=1 Tax=Haloechinothrix salitolerans TaxID=926830 RepID=A0ABW2C6S3_9PSEU
MNVKLYNPKREVRVPGPLRVKDLCDHLGFPQQTVLVIKDDELVTREAVLEDTDTVEIRPVMSGGAR